MRVLVPFGARKVFEVGYVVGLKETSEFKCKNIVKVIDRVFDEDKLELAKWISQKYFCNLSDAIRLLVPPGTSTSVDKIKTKTEKYVYLNEDIDIDLEKIKSDKHKKVILFLQDNNNAPKAVLKEMLDVSDAILKTLEKNNYIILKYQHFKKLRSDNWSTTKATFKANWQANTYTITYHFLPQSFDVTAFALSTTLRQMLSPGFKKILLSANCGDDAI